MTHITLYIPVAEYGGIATLAAAAGRPLDRYLAQRVAASTPAPAPAPAELPAIPPAQSMGLFDGVQEDTPLTIPTPTPANA